MEKIYICIKKIPSTNNIDNVAMLAENLSSDEFNKLITFGENYIMQIYDQRYEVIDNILHIYLNERLILKVTSLTNYAFTNLALKTFSKNFFLESPSIYINAYLSISMMLTLNKKRKIVKKDFYNKITLKDYNITYKEYIHNPIFDYVYKNDIYKILLNYETFEFPSIKYPVINQDIRIWHSNNTEELKDNNNLNFILSHFQIKIGECYDNIERIYRILEKNEYNKIHKIEYCSGWILSKRDSIPIAHCWLVVDNNSIIDTSSLYIPELEQFYNDINTGVFNNTCFNLNRNIFSKWAITAINKEIPFNEKVPYGKAREEYIYIGGKSSKEEALRFAKELISKNPNHPSFININKETGTNKLLDIIRSKM